MINLHAVLKLLLRDSALTSTPASVPRLVLGWLRSDPISCLACAWLLTLLGPHFNHYAGTQIVGIRLYRRGSALLASLVLRGSVVCGLDRADVFDFCWLLLAFAGFCLVPPARAMVTDRAIVERYEWAQLRPQHRSASAAFIHNNHLRPRTCHQSDIRSQPGL